MVHILFRGFFSYFPRQPGQKPSKSGGKDFNKDFLQKKPRKRHRKITFSKKASPGVSAQGSALSPRADFNGYPVQKPGGNGQNPSAYGGLRRIFGPLFERGYTIWRDLLESGKVKSIAEIARANKVDGSYVSRMLDLTLLAPDIIEAILDGKEPSGLSLTKLTKKRIPPLWEEQRLVYGFNSAPNGPNG